MHSSVFNVGCVLASVVHIESRTQERKVRRRRHGASLLFVLTPRLMYRMMRCAPVAWWSSGAPAFLQSIGHAMSHVSWLTFAGCRGTVDGHVFPGQQSVVGFLVVVQAHVRGVPSCAESLCCARRKMCTENDPRMTTGLNIGGCFYVRIRALARISASRFRTFLFMFIAYGWIG